MFSLESILFLYVIFSGIFMIIYLNASNNPTCEIDEFVYLAFFGFVLGWILVPFVFLKNLKKFFNGEIKW